MVLTRQPEMIDLKKSSKDFFFNDQKITSRIIDKPSSYLVLGLCLNSLL